MGEPARPVYGSQVRDPGTPQSMGQLVQDSLGSQTLFPQDDWNCAHWAEFIPEGQG